VKHDISKATFILGEIFIQVLSKLQVGLFVFSLFSSKIYIFWILDTY
jgi:hypothetical protein